MRSAFNPSAHRLLLPVDGQLLAKQLWDKLGARGAAHL